ncbi:hypothetical protein [Singulisphaera sp. PoT]|uniref:hypothetical protein n=1 Tax=Singulisphaera sp. PoT TaxID=3411797 RepID=UPI003BF46476
MTTLLLALGLTLATPDASAAEDRARVVIVVGAPGTPEYGTQFQAWAGLWQAAASKSSAEVTRIGVGDPSDKTPDRDKLRAALTEGAATSQEPLWLVLIGHGTFDGRSAKFNMRGPDVTEAELAEWTAPIKRPIAVIDCSACSGPFLSKLSGPNRVIITATKSGHEENYARLGQYLAESIADPRADLDKDGQVSLLEAFLSASHGVAEYYRSHSQLATEHPLLDDNGDRLGTPADWFKGVRATKRAKDGSPLDGPRAHQLYLVRSERERSIPPEVRKRRDGLELAVAALRDRKDKLGEDEYFAELEKLMTDLARLYRDLDQGGSHKH